MIRAATGALLVALVALGPLARASAQSIQDFETARAAYEARDFARAVQYFEELVGTDPPRLTGPLLLEARKYLGAAYMFEGRSDAADHQFELLLRADPEYPLDPVLFPAAVLERFNAVRERLQIEARAAAARRELEEQLARERERAARLLAVAEEEVLVDVENSRWAALIPWGCGQFLNGDDGLGWAFFASETVLLGAAFGALAWHDSLMAQVAAAYAGVEPDVVERANPLLTAATATNWAALATLAVVGIAGIVQAQLAFQPARSVRYQRPIPDDLREPLDESDLPPQEDRPAISAIPFGFRF